jgi:hypothetical protein
MALIFDSIDEIINLRSWEIEFVFGVEVGWIGRFGGHH